MIYAKHFKLNFEQHETVGEPECSGKIIIPCSTETPIVLHSFFLLMSASYYHISIGFLTAPTVGYL